MDFFTEHNMRSSRRRALTNKLLDFLCVAISFAALIPLFSIVILVVGKGLPLLRPQVFTQLPPAAGITGGGFGNAVVGTATMVAIALAIAAPLGILAAIYITEYNASGKLAAVVRFVAKMLTGIPAIICGLFAYAVIVLTTGKFSAWAGGVALSILILPTILLTAEQGLLSVLRSYREASFGLGATTFQTIWRIILPEATPAILTGIMLSLARAAGETAPLIFTALFSQYWMRSFFALEPTASLSVLIYNFATMPFDHQVSLAWTASLILMALVTFTNITAQLAFGKK